MTSPDPGLIACIDLDTGEAMLPLSEFAPLVDRVAELEATVAQLRERLARIAVEAAG